MYREGRVLPFFINRLNYFFLFFLINKDLSQKYWLYIRAEDKITWARIARWKFARSNFWQNDMKREEGIERRMFLDEDAERNRRSCQRSAMHLPLIRATTLDPGCTFFPTMTLHFVTIIAIIRAWGERARFNAQAARTMVQYIYTPSMHLHTRTHTYTNKYTHMYRYDPELVATAARNRPSIFPSIARFIVFWQRRCELWFRATTSGRLLPSRAVVAIAGRLILSTLEFAPRIWEHLTHHHHLPSSLLAATLLASSVSFW